MTQEGCMDCGGIFLLTLNFSFYHSEIVVKKKNDKATATTAANNEAKPKAKIWDEAAVQREEIKRREMEGREKQRVEQDRLKQKKEEEEQERQREAAAAKKRQTESQRGKKAAAGREQKGKESSIGGKSPVDVKQTANPKQTQPKGMKTIPSSGVVTTKKKEPKSHAAKIQRNKPDKGKPKKKRCGCYGNKHKL